MITIHFTDRPDSPIFQHCANLVAQVYLEQLGLPGFENAEPPDVFFYAEDGDRGGGKSDRIIGVGGIDFSEPTFTEVGFIDGTEKLLSALQVPKRNEVILAEVCRVATLEGYHGIFSAIGFGIVFYMHSIKQPRTDFLISSLDPRFCEGVKRRTGFPFIKIEGEWDFDAIPTIYHSWYGGNPKPIAVLHDVKDCFSIIAQKQFKLHDQMHIVFEKEMQDGF